MSLKNRISSIMLWSVISAAFIGPGTLATATAAGSGYQFQLVWALVFSMLSCLLLQEMSARVAILSGEELGKSLSKIIKNKALIYFIGGAVILGCAAYEAGNIIGAVSGLSLIVLVDKVYLIALVGVLCIGLLLKNDFKKLVTLLGYVVASMGLLFLYLSFYVSVDAIELLKGSVIPTIPKGGSLIVLGLIGTTIVPYNLFLGSGVGRLEDLKSMRFGLSVSVIFGGFISIAILVVATRLNAAGGFIELANYLSATIGPWSYYFMAFGLFAAGLTSSLTAPLAAALITKSLVTSQSKNKWYKLTYLSILAIGLLFGLLDIKPIPLILAAQAFNGLILPILVLALLLLVNNSAAITAAHLNSKWSNILTLLVLNITFIIGANSFLKVAENFIDFNETFLEYRIVLLQLLALPILIYAIRKVSELRKI